MLRTPLFQAMLDGDHLKLQAILGSKEGKDHVNVVDYQDVSERRGRGGLLSEQRASCEMFFAWGRFVVDPHSGLLTRALT